MELHSRHSRRLRPDKFTLAVNRDTAQQPPTMPAEHRGPAELLKLPELPSGLYGPMRPPTARLLDAGEGHAQVGIVM